MTLKSKDKRPRNQRGVVSPVDNALLFGHHSLEVGELEEMVVEVVQVKNTHQQEGGGNENPGEQLGHGKLLQAQVLQAAHIKKNSENSIKEKEK